MKPADKLKEIEELYSDFDGNDRILWLIARVKRLTEALEFALECCLSDDTVECHYKAKKALDGDE